MNNDSLQKNDLLKKEEIETRARIIEIAWDLAPIFPDKDQRQKELKKNLSEWVKENYKKNFEEFLQATAKQMGDIYDIEKKIQYLKFVISYFINCKHRLQQQPFESPSLLSKNASLLLLQSDFTLEKILGYLNFEDMIHLLESLSTSENFWIKEALKKILKKTIYFSYLKFKVQTDIANAVPGHLQGQHEMLKACIADCIPGHLQGQRKMLKALVAPDGKEIHVTEAGLLFIRSGEGYLSAALLHPHNSSNHYYYNNGEKPSGFKTKYQKVINNHNNTVIIITTHGSFLVWEWKKEKNNYEFLLKHDLQNSNLQDMEIGIKAEITNILFPPVKIKNILFPDDNASSLLISSSEGVQFFQLKQSENPRYEVIQTLITKTFSPAAMCLLPNKQLFVAEKIDDKKDWQDFSFSKWIFQDEQKQYVKEYTGNFAEKENFVKKITDLCFSSTTSLLIMVETSKEEKKTGESSRTSSKKKNSQKTDEKTSVITVWCITTDFDNFKLRLAKKISLPPGSWIPSHALQEDDIFSFLIPACASAKFEKERTLLFRLEVYSNQATLTDVVKTSRKGQRMIGVYPLPNSPSDRIFRITMQHFPENSRDPDTTWETAETITSPFEIEMKDIKYLLQSATRRSLNFLREKFEEKNATSFSFAPLQSSSSSSTSIDKGKGKAKAEENRGRDSDTSSTPLAAFFTPKKIRQLHLKPSFDAQDAKKRAADQENKQEGASSKTPKR